MESLRNTRTTTGLLHSLVRTECPACAIKLGVVLNQLNPTTDGHQTSIQVVNFLLDRVAPQ